MYKKCLLAAISLLGVNTYAAGYSEWAIPTTVELVSGGVLIQGAFGDPNTCGNPNFIFVSEQSSNYNAVLSMTLSAFHAKREMRFYSGKCSQVGFHWAVPNINETLSGQSVYIR